MIYFPAELLFPTASNYIFSPFCLRGILRKIMARLLQDNSGAPEITPSFVFVLLDH